jgi:hypothetical protein
MMPKPYFFIILLVVLSGSALTDVIAQEMLKQNKHSRLHQPKSVFIQFNSKIFI